MTSSLVMSDVTAALGRKYAAGVDSLRPENVVQCVSFSMARPESYQCWVDIAALALMMAQRLHVAPAAEPTPAPELPIPAPQKAADWTAPPQRPLDPEHVADLLEDSRTRPALFGYPD